MLFFDDVDGNVEIHSDLNQKETLEQEEFLNFEETWNEMELGVVE